MKIPLNTAIRYARLWCEIRYETACFRRLFSLLKKSIFLISRTNSLSLCERSVAHLPDALLALTFRHPCLFVNALWRIFLMRSVAHRPDALWAFTFRHPCLPSPMGKEGSKAKLLKISRKADRDAPCDQARMLDSVRTEVLHDAKPTNERKLALGLRLKQGCFSCLPRVLQGCKTN